MRESKMNAIKYQLQAYTFADYTQPFVRIEKDGKKVVEKILTKGNLV